MFITNYTSDNFKEKNIDTVIIPIGSLEAHGHHLPLGTDIFSPRLFCEIIDKKIGDTLWIAPEIPYGNSYDLSIYPGTVTMPSNVMAEYIFHVGKSFYNNGIKNIIFLKFPPKILKYFKKKKSKLFTANKMRNNVKTI